MKKKYMISLMFFLFFLIINATEEKISINEAETNIEEKVITQSEIKKVLETGVEEWNEFRIKNPNIEWGNYEFTNMDFTDRDFSGADFSYMNFKGTKFINAKLVGVNFTNANLYDCNFFQADMRNSIFIGADMRSAGLKKVVLIDADMTGATLSKGMIDLMKKKNIKNFKKIEWR